MNCHIADFYKLLFMNGYSSTAPVEVIDLRSNTTTCQNFAQYPLYVSRAVGGLVDGQTPLVCGGMTSAATNLCYLYQNGKWNTGPSMNEPRSSFMGLPGEIYIGAFFFCSTGLPLTRT